MSDFYTTIVPVNIPNAEAKELSVKISDWLQANEIIDEVEILLGQQVFDNGGNGLDEVSCPKCGANNIDSDWGEAIEQWTNNEKSDVICSNCNTASSVVNYKFVPTWAFGNIGIKFWNGPKLTDVFLEKIKEVVKTDIKVVYGRI